MSASFSRDGSVELEEVMGGAEHRPFSMIGRLALRGLVNADDRRKIQHFAHRVAREMRKVPRRYELIYRRRQQPALIDVP